MNRKQQDTPARKRRAVGAPSPSPSSSDSGVSTSISVALANKNGEDNPILVAMGGHTPRAGLTRSPSTASNAESNWSLDNSVGSSPRLQADDTRVVEQKPTRAQTHVEEAPMSKEAQKPPPPLVLRSTSSSSSSTASVSRIPKGNGKRKRSASKTQIDDTIDEDMSTDETSTVYAREHVLNSQEPNAGDEGGFSIEPSDRAVEHRANKLVRREIVIASPAAQEDEDLESTAIASTSSNDVPTSSPIPTSEHFDMQPVDMILHIFSFLVSSEDLLNLAYVSKRWRELTNRKSLCRALSDLQQDGSVNWLNFQNLGVKNKGTEGTCFKCRQRSSGKILAMKKARVFPKGEGVPYYMLRELAVLQGMRHDHIASLELVSLADDELHVFFPYVDKTLHELINPTGDPNGGRVLPEPVIRRLLHQLLDAMAYCHRRGVLHRNLKPKHLLVETEHPDTLEDAQLQLSDFALVRATGIPRRTYTMEVVTLWYRPPEILMGVRGYSSAVDVWSAGCIFAEMAQGRPLFTGISEIDQLFQIFSKLSTPNSETWPGFTSLPNYDFKFPNWRQKPFHRLFPTISPQGLDLMKQLLLYNPEERISAEQALRHPYFQDVSPEMPRLSPKIKTGDAVYRMREGCSTPEQVELYHAFLRQAEAENWKETKYLHRQRTLRPSHRSMLVDWLIEVVDVFEMCLRTAFLAVNYTDRFLDKELVRKNQFQLLGATCLHVASKCEDVSYIGVEDLAMCADNVYTSSEVLQMEEKLLTTLQFSLTVPTALDLLHVFERMIPPMQKKTPMLAQYLLELTLQEHQFLRYRPSVVATCCLSMAMYTVEGYPMTRELADATQLTWRDLKECMGELQTLFSLAPTSELAVIKKRYSKADRCKVAQITPPSSFHMAF